MRLFSLETKRYILSFLTTLFFSPQPKISVTDFPSPGVPLDADACDYRWVANGPWVRRLGSEERYSCAASEAIYCSVDWLTDWWTSVPLVTTPRIDCRTNGLSTVVWPASIDLLQWNPLSDQGPMKASAWLFAYLIVLTNNDIRERF